MASWQERPSPGMAIWHPEYKNGVIREIDYDNDKLVYCDFYDNGLHTVAYEDVYGTFDERLNQFVLMEVM